MEVARIRVSSTAITVLERKTIPSGLIGGTITIEYADATWAGLQKTVVFKGAVTKDVITDDSSVRIPGEVLADAGKKLYVGVYGTDLVNNKAIPTLYADLGVIKAAADPYDDNTADPALPMWFTLSQKVDDFEKEIGEFEKELNKSVEMVTAASENAENAAEDAEKASTSAEKAAEAAEATMFGVDAATKNANAAAENAERATAASSQAANIANEAAQNAIAQAQNAGAAAQNANAAAEETRAAKNDLVQTVNTALEEIREVVDDGTDAPPIVPSAVGSVISIDDSADRLLRGLKVYGKTTQNAEPAPTEPVPLESAGDSGSIVVAIHGKNLYGNGDVSVSVFKDFTLKNPLPAGTYTISAVVTSTDTKADRCLIAFINGKTSTSNVNCVLGRTKRASVTVTLNRTVTEIRFCSSNNTSNSSGSKATFTDIQIESGSVATKYAAYEQSLSVATEGGLPGIPVTSGGNYTDENGQQWICDEIDFAKGKYFQRIDRVVLDGSEDERWRLNDNGVFSCQTVAENYDKINKCMCSHYPVKLTTTSASIPDKTLGMYNSTATNYLWIHDSSYGTVEELVAALSADPVTVLYPISYLEYDLTVEELAAYSALYSTYQTTVISNDANADMEVRYVADTKLYIDKKFSELAAVLVNNV